jgi:hypothetical protein
MKFRSKQLFPATCPFLFVQNIITSNLFSDIPNLYSCFDVRNRVSYSYKTAGKIIYLYIKIFTLLGMRA